MRKNLLFFLFVVPLLTLTGSTGGLETNPPSSLLNSVVIDGNLHDTAVAFDYDGGDNMVVVGWTQSDDLPTKDAYQESYGGGSYDCFISKISPTGELLWLTFLGGSGNEVPWDVVVDSQTNLAYVVGWTDSDDFPTLGASQPTRAGGMDGFVTVVNANGVVVRSTYLGGDDLDVPFAVELTTSEVVVVGETQSSDFAGLPIGGADIFLSHLDRTTLAHKHMVRVGGADDDSPRDITVMPDGQFVVVGNTKSTDLPTSTNVFDETYGGGTFDGFVAWHHPNGSLITFSYFGGAEEDGLNVVALTPQGQVVVVGYTLSTTLPGLSAVYGNRGGDDVVVARLKSFSEVESTIVLSGNKDEVGLGATVDSRGNIYLTGWTSSSDFYTTGPSQTTYGNGGRDAIYAKLNPDLVPQTCSYLGGDGDDLTRVIQIAPSDFGVVMVGRTDTNNFFDHTSYSSEDPTGRKVLLIQLLDETDEDMDGMPTHWESSNGLNPLVDEANEDLDGDGLPNYYEYTMGFDVQNPNDGLVNDEDRDGMPNGWEYRYGLDLYNAYDKYLDKDSDGLPNYYEYTYQLDPTNASDAANDHDSDGLTTLEEYYLNTNPRNSDSDGDGFSDGLERTFGGLLGDPTNSDDNPLTRLLMLVLVLAVLVGVGAFIAVKIRSEWLRYHQRREKKLSVGKGRLQELLDDYNEQRTVLERFQQTITEELSGPQYRDKLSTFRGYYGPIKDLERRRNDLWQYKTLRELTDQYEDLEDVHISTMTLYRELSRRLSQYQEEGATGTQADDLTCIHCGAILDLPNLPCPSCGKKPGRCLVCQRFLRFGDEIGSCVYCGREFHYGHLVEAVKTSGKCPTCRHRMREEEVLKTSLGVGKRS